MTAPELRLLDAWVRNVTVAHDALEDPWCVTVDPADPAQAVGRVDPVAATRRGHGGGDRVVLTIPAGTSFYAAREAVIQALATAAGHAEGREG